MKHLKSEKTEEEKSPASGFGTPRKGQAINLLDAVSDHEKCSAVHTVPTLKGRISGYIFALCHLSIQFVPFFS